jgi:drug/metabolite transporter (DMT)-like permease
MQDSRSVFAYLALAAVCFFWGTVYLAFRIAVETFPPLVLMGGRFFFAGLIVLAIAWAVGARLPERDSFLRTSRNGLLTLGLGVGTIAFSVQWIPSGLVAMLTTTSPFWIVGVEAAMPGGDRPRLWTLAGLGLGLAGCLLLVAPGAATQGLGSSALLPFLILQLGCAGFALGSVLERKHRTESHPIVNAAIQEVATGAVFLVAALVLPHGPITWTWKGIGAVLYLVVFGGIVAFSSFLYAMKHLPASLVSIYAYVNPAVAVLVGALLYGESFRWLEALSLALVLIGVVIVERSSGPHPAAGQKAASRETPLDEAPIAAGRQL